MSTRIFIVRIGQGLESTSIASFIDLDDAQALAAKRARGEAELDDVVLSSDDEDAIAEWSKVCGEMGIDYDERCVLLEQCKLYKPGEASTL